MLRLLKKRRNTVLIILFWGITLIVYAPYELMIPNNSDIGVPFVLYGWIPLLLFIIYLIFATTILINIKNDNVIHYLEWFSFSIAICAYLQGNWLCISNEVLNGDSINWEDYWGRILLHGVILQVIFVLLFILWKKKALITSNISAFISFVLAGAQIVSLIAVLITNWDYIKTPVVEETYCTDYELCSIGKEGTNIVWFLLDMYDSEYFKKNMVLEPELVNELDGFTCFNNYAGTYPTTAYAMDLLYTGEYYRNEKPRENWVPDAKENGIWLDELVDRGYEFTTYMPNGLCPMPPVDLKNTETGKVKLKSTYRFAIQMYKLVLNKYGPNLIKPVIAMDGSEFAYWKGLSSANEMCSDDNVLFRKKIESQNFETIENKQFKLFYLEGAHYPYHTSSDGRHVGKQDTSVLENAEGALYIVEEYLHKLKEIGAYDNTVVIITGDHGYYRHGTLTSPVMLVKPANSHGEMIVNDAPTSQLDFGATVLQLVGVENYQQYGESVYDIPIDSTRERLYYQYYLYEWGSSGCRLIEFNIDNNGNSEENFHLTGTEYTTDGRKIDHFQYCRTCNNEERADDWDKQIDWQYVVHKKRNNYPD